MPGINSVSILLMIAGLVILAWFLGSLRTIKNRRAQITQISSLPDTGRVKVVGKAVEGALFSPIKNSPCVVWQLEVKEGQADEEGKYTWNPVSFLSSAEPFEIEDESGRILIQPEKTRLHLGPTKTYYYPENQIADALEKVGVETTTPQGSNRELVLCESILAPGEQVYVNGVIKQSEGNKTISSGNNSLVIADVENSGINEPSLFEIFLDLIIIACYIVTFYCIVELIFPYKGPPSRSIRMTREEIMGYFIFLKYPVFIGLFTSIILWFYKYFVLKIISFINKSPGIWVVISFGFLSILYLVVSSTL